MQCQAIKTTVYLLVLTVMVHCNAGWANDWKLEKQKNDVSIYSKKVDFGYKEIMVKTIVEASPYALIALLDDVAVSCQWIHNCIKVKILDETSPTERLVNSFFDAPWPISDRDMVTFSTTTFSNNTVQIKISNRGDSIPHSPKYVRMQNIHGMWEANTLEKGQTEIIYTGGGNPAGNIPAFIANQGLISTTFKTFQNLSKFISLEKYQPTEITD
jgi:hypothetical protein